MAKKYSSKSHTVKENLVLPKSGKGTKVAAKITVSMTEKSWAISNSESLNSARSAKHCSHLHCRNSQDEESKGCRCAEVEDSKPRFVNDPHPTILPTSYEHYFHREDQQEDWSEPHKKDLQSVMKQPFNNYFSFCSCLFLFVFVDNIIKGQQYESDFILFYLYLSLFGLSLISYLLILLSLISLSPYLWLISYWRISGPYPIGW